MPESMSREISPIEQEQIEKLKQIGDYLRQLREDHMLTLEQVSTKTMIQPRLLRAIEAGRLHELPEPVYIKGFLKRYSDALGLDGDVVAQNFPTELDERALHPSWKDSPAAQLRPVHLYAAYIGLIVLAISGLSYLLTRSVQFAPPQVAVSPTQTTASPASPSAPANSPTAAGADASRSTVPSLGPTPSATSEKPVRVDVTLTGQSWIRVSVDGKVELEEILQEGTQRSWSADREILIRAGNAGGVMVAYNGEAPKPMGEPGTVEQRIFTVDTAPETSASLPPTPAN